MPDIFRPCAGAIVFNKEGLILLGNRIDTKDDAWQFSQGGIEQGETPALAAKREIFEEMSVTSIELICSDEKPNRYVFPEEVKQNFKKRGILSVGQDIYFSLYFFTGNDAEINVQTEYPEFKSYAWKSFDFAVDNIVEFKKQVYVDAKNKFEPLIKQYLHKLT